MFIFRRIEIGSRFDLILEDFQLPQMTTKRPYVGLPRNRGQMVLHVKSYGFGGMDDMGLGKILQTISFFLTSVAKRTKILILAPSSLIYNWKTRIFKFVPQMEVAVYGLSTEMNSSQPIRR